MSTGTGKDLLVMMADRNPSDTVPTKSTKTSRKIAAATTKKPSKSEEKKKKKLDTDDEDDSNDDQTSSEEIKERTTPSKKSSSSKPTKKVKKAKAKKADSSDDESGSTDSDEDDERKTKATTKAAGKRGVFIALQKTLGPKSSKKGVQDVEQAISKANLTAKDHIALINVFKSIPLDGTGDKILKKSLKKSIKGQSENGVDKKEAKASRPYQSLYKNGELAIEVINKIRKHLKSPNSLNWGTYSQTKVMMETFAALVPELEKTHTTFQSFFYKKMVPTMADFNWVFPIWSFRIGCLAKLVSLLKKKGMVKYVSEGRNAPGFIFHEDVNMEQVREEYIFKDGDETLTMEKAKKLFKETDDEDVHLVTAYQFAMGTDVRQCLMSKTIRMARTAGGNNSEMVRKIVGAMIFIIKSCLGDLPEYPDYSLDPDSQFCKHYYAARSVLMRTKRNIDRAVFGAGTGANTRSGDLIGEEEFDPEAAEGADLGAIEPIAFSLDD